MIRVFPRKTNATPIDTKVWFTGPPRCRLRDDLVCVSCTFTYDKPKAERLAKAWERADYHVELGGPAYDDAGGKFVPGRFIAHGYTITSRGCGNKCWFCSVWKREGGIRQLEIQDGWNILDSNLLQCSETHIKAVFGMLAKQPQKAEFTGGLEAARLKDWHVDLLSDIKPKRLYFAYDTPDDWDPLVIASRMVKKARICGKRDRMCYVLIGSPKDTLDKAEARLRAVFHLGLTPMAMLYRDDKGETDVEWSRFQRLWARPHLIYARMKTNKGA